ncbi:TPA: aminoacyltransferase [Streptococcus suis]
MSYTYRVGITAEDHDTFVKNSPQANLLQSSQWARVKTEWQNERLGFYKDNKLVAVASVLIRKLLSPASFTIIYIPRGPIMDYKDKELVSFVLSALKEYGKLHRSIFIKFDPFLPLSKRDIDGKIEESQQTIKIKDLLVDLDCNWVGRSKMMGDTIQPTYHAVLYKDVFSENSLHKRVRQNIRTARNKGLEISIGREELLDDFSELLKKTEKRKAIHLRGKEYYHRILTAYPEDSYFTVAYLNVVDRYDHITQQVEKLIEEKNTFTSKTRQTKVDNNLKELNRLNSELDFLSSLMETKGSFVPLAGTLTINFGTTSENIYAGMDEDFKHYQPALLTWVETAKQAFERGASWQNLGGIEPTLDGGLYQFKSQFNPTIEEYIGEFDLILSPILYNILQAILKNRKKLRNIKHDIFSDK